MHAVLIEVDVTGVPAEAGLQMLREQIVPAIKQLPGFNPGPGWPATPTAKGSR